MFALALRHAERLDPAARAELLEAQAHECMLTNLPEQAIRARLAAVDLRRERGDRQPELEVENFRLPDIGPGDILDFSYEYFAQASTGFGETGIFAAIGDPFDLSAGGGRFDLHVGDAVGPGPGPGIPSPSTLAIFGLGLFLLSISVRCGRRPPQPLYNRS